MRSSSDLKWIIFTSRKETVGIESFTGKLKGTVAGVLKVSVLNSNVSAVFVSLPVWATLVSDQTVNTPINAIRLFITIFSHTMLKMYQKYSGSIRKCYF